MSDDLGALCPKLTFIKSINFGLPLLIDNKATQAAATRLAKHGAKTRTQAMLINCRHKGEGKQRRLKRWQR